MLGKWVVNLDGEWWLLDGDSMVKVNGLESISEPVRVLTDFGNAVVNVDTVSGPGSYAAPLIEKQLRDAGTLDGPGRVLVHQRQRGGGTTRVLYSAVPARIYADYFAQAAKRPDHCVLFSFVSAMYRHASAAGDVVNGVVFRHGRQLELLVCSGRDLVGTAHATAFSTRDDDLKQAVSALASALREMTGEAGELPARIRWFSFGDGPDEPQGLVTYMAELTGIPVDVAAGETLAGPGSAMSTSINELIAALHNTDAVNGAASRLLYQAERALPAVAGLLLAASLALFGVAWHWAGQTGDLRAQVQATSREDTGVALQHLTEKLPPMGGAAHESPAVRKQLAFLSRLDVAMAAPDLRRIVRDIGDATPDGMRIVGISFATTDAGAAIAIDGVVQKALRQAMGDLQQLSVALRAKGYRISEDAGDAMDEHNSFRLTMNWEPNDDQI